MLKTYRAEILAALTGVALAVAFFAVALTP
jgi:uncharacterized membrane protein